MKEKVVRDRDGWVCKVLEETDEGVIVDWKFVGGEEKPTRLIKNEDIAWRGWVEVNQRIADKR